MEEQLLWLAVVFEFTLELFPLPKDLVRPHFYFTCFNLVSICF